MGEETRQEAERWGAMSERMKNMSDDISDLKKGQENQGRNLYAAIAELSKTVVEQGKEITKLKTQIALAGAFGGMVGSLVVGLVLLLAQKGSP